MHFAENHLQCRVQAFSDSAVVVETANHPHTAAADWRTSKVIRTKHQTKHALRFEKAKKQQSTKITKESFSTLQVTYLKNNREEKDSIFQCVKRNRSLFILAGTITTNNVWSVISLETWSEKKEALLRFRYLRRSFYRFIILVWWLKQELSTFITYQTLYFKRIVSRAMFFCTFFKFIFTLIFEN